MLDGRGIRRGSCKECEGECGEYIARSDSFDCAYCGHLPIHHQRIVDQMPDVGDTLSSASCRPSSSSCGLTNKTRLVVTDKTDDDDPNLSNTASNQDQTFSVDSHHDRNGPNASGSNKDAEALKKKGVAVTKSKLPVPITSRTDNAEINKDNGERYAEANDEDEEELVLPRTKKCVASKRKAIVDDDDSNEGSDGRGFESSDEDEEKDGRRPAKKVAAASKRQAPLPSTSETDEADNNQDNEGVDSAVSDEDAVENISRPAKKSKPSKKGKKIPTTKPTGSKPYLDLGPLPLPKLPSDVLKVLRDPKKDVLKIWRKLINVSVAHYKKYNIGNKGHYRLIGEKMLAAYPRIGFQNEGKHLWTRFTKDLSSTIRKKTWKESFNTADTERGVLAPNMSVIYQERPERKDQRKEDFPRSNHRSKELLALEIAKSSPLMKKVADYVRDTYDIRTDLIKADVRMPILLAEHEFLMESKYFQIEAALFFGDENFDALKSNVSRFIAAIAAVENSTPIQSIDKLQATLVKKDPIFLITHDHPEFSLELPDAKNLSTSAQNKDFPRLVVRCGDEGVEELALTYFGRCMHGIESLSVGILNIMSIYLMFDIPFPSHAEKLMDLLECVVLGLPSTGFGQKWKKYISDLLKNA